MPSTSATAAREVDIGRSSAFDGSSVSGVGHQVQRGVKRRRTDDSMCNVTTNRVLNIHVWTTPAPMIAQCLVPVWTRCETSTAEFRYRGIVVFVEGGSYRTPPDISILCVVAEVPSNNAGNRCIVVFVLTYQCVQSLWASSILLRLYKTERWLWCY